LAIPVEDKNGQTALVMSWASEHPVQGGKEDEL